LNLYKLIILMNYFLLKVIILILWNNLLRKFLFIFHIHNNGLNNIIIIHLKHRIQNNILFMEMENLNFYNEYNYIRKYGKLIKIILYFYYQLSYQDVFLSKKIYFSKSIIFKYFILLFLFHNLLK